MYIKRIIDEQLEKYLKVFGGVLIEGPKYCGKTRTCEEFAKTKIYFQNPSDRKRLSALIEQDPLLLFSTDKPLLLDEWQEYPVLWDSVRYYIDMHNSKGDFLLTGSSQSRNIKTMHSGVGRIGKILLRPLSIYEMQISQSSISIEELFDGYKPINQKCNLTLDDYMNVICKGGWPASINLDYEQSLVSIYEYAQDLYKLDTFDKNNRQSTILRKLLYSLSRNILTDISFEKIRKEVVVNENELTERTLYNYYEKLKNYFIVEDLPAWDPHIRSKARLIKKVKRNFIDPSIAVGILRLNKEKLIDNLDYYGFLFESLVIKDLRILIQNLGGNVYYYKDNTNLDIDVIVQLNNGRWGALQVKVGSSKIDEAAKELDLFLNKIDYTYLEKPSFVGIITGTEYAYTRSDDKIVIPLGLLKP